MTAKFNQKEVDMGKQEEMEHTKDPKEAEKMAKTHLRKIPDYYTRLSRMEREAQAEKGKNRGARK